MPPKGRTANRILETGHAPEARAVRGLSARAVPNRRTFVVTSDQPHRADALCLLNDELLDHLGLPGLPALPGSRRATAVADLLVETAQQAIVDDIRPAHDLGRMLKLVSELRDDPLGGPHGDRDAQVSNRTVAGHQLQRRSEWPGLGALGLEIHDVAGRLDGVDQRAERCR